MKTFNRAGFVYLLRAENGACKIGRSKTPDARVKDLDISPLALTLIHRIATNDACWLEKRLHVKYSAKRVRGEWYGLSATDISSLVSLTCVDRPSLPCRKPPVRKPKARRGPGSSTPVEERMDLHVHPALKAKVLELAAAAGQTISEWVTDAICRVLGIDSRDMPVPRKRHPRRKA